MRRTITILAVALGLAFAATGFARDIEDGKLIIKITKDGKYQVGDALTVDKVGMYGAVGSFYQDGKDKNKPLQGIIVKKAEKANDEQKHMIYVTGKRMALPVYLDMDGKEQLYSEPEPAPAPAPAAAPAAEAAPAAAAPAPEPQADPNKH
ncbi:MAG: hypothetical protein JSS42_00565 [Proteobacteria bacterium]|uniref:hypothetical protein n=1 Tax=Rudaea sp. TaxID=2136325 RepID=UPI00322025A4|nr:hypothetical protein [Pseudomonadota bacterium]